MSRLRLWYPLAIPYSECVGGAVYYGSEAIFFFIVAKATLGPLRLPADQAALAEMLRLASKTHM